MYGERVTIERTISASGYDGPCSPQCGVPYIVAPLIVPKHVLVSVVVHVRVRPLQYIEVHAVWRTEGCASDRWRLRQFIQCNDGEESNGQESY